MEAYLDNAATTRVFPEVREKMVRVMEEDFGNPSSKHTKGMDAEKYIRETKEILAKDLKCTPGEIIFTSGGTESNNTALIGGAYANRRAGKHIITTRIEHASVHEPLAFLEELGYQVTYLPVDKNGQVSPSELEKAVTEETILVSIMFVNNEIGAVEDVKLCRRSCILTILRFYFMLMLSRHMANIILCRNVWGSICVCQRSQAAWT